MLEKQDIIVLGYPTQFSNAPVIVRDFIHSNAYLWKGKKVFCVNTMGLFSGDGTGCTARILKKYGAEILGGMQIKMPVSVYVLKKRSRCLGIRFWNNADMKNMNK